MGAWIMILFLSHMGLTVKKLDKSLASYCKAFDFRILSDAERRGHAVELVTGIPGFHTRTVYLSVSDFQHLEMFEFYHPEAFPHDGLDDIYNGKLVCVLKIKNGTSLIGNLQASNFFCSTEKSFNNFKRAKTIKARDPDGLTFNIEELISPSAELETADSKRVLNAEIYVDKIEHALEFYHHKLGLKKVSEGEGIFKRSLEKSSSEVASRWVLLAAAADVCLKLIQPINGLILPTRPWKMERIGFTHIAFGVKDITNYYKELKQKGVHFNSSPQTLGVGPHKDGKVVYMNSPDGFAIELIESPLIEKQAAQFG